MVRMNQIRLIWIAALLLSCFGVDDRKLTGQKASDAFLQRRLDQIADSYTQQTTLLWVLYW
jgi:hypothetical protein